MDTINKRTVAVRRSACRLTAASLLLSGILCALAYPGTCVAESTERVGVWGILHRSVETREEPVTPTPAQQRLKDIAERMDKAGLLYSARVVVDKDAGLLEPPAIVASFAGTEYTVAQEPPEVEFAVVPVEPLFLGESPVASKSEISNEAGPWSNWSQAAYDVRTGKFYSSVGDHGKYDAHIYIVEYDPAAKRVRCLPETNKVLGRTRQQFGEGKIHGWLDFYKSKHLDREHLWFCTYWAKYPEPDEEDYATGYDGGHIMSCDVITGDIVDYGVPLRRASWPYHRMDTKRGIVYAVGMFREFLAWDANEQRTLWAGYLPPGMGWWERAILIDEETGMVYTSNAHPDDPDMHMIKYDPFKNRFSRLDCCMPITTAATSGKGGPQGKPSHMRAQTAHRGPDGLFYGVTYSGQLFSFDPVKEEIVDKGLNWCGDQRYTASMARSPGGRYIYYLPGAHGHGYSDGSPLIQYDTQTDSKKVLAFFLPYYYEKYGYTPGGTFSIVLDDKGEKLFILWNGAFAEHSGEMVGDTFGHCSIMLVSIPESERPE